MDENADVRGAYVEFSEQTSIPKVLSINGFEFFGRPLLYVDFNREASLHLELQSEPCHIQRDQTSDGSRNENR